MSDLVGNRRSMFRFRTRAVWRFFQWKHKSYSLLLGIIYAIVISTSLTVVLIFIYYSSLARQLSEIDQQISDEFNKLIYFSMIFGGDNERPVSIEALVRALNEIVAQSAESPFNAMLYVLQTNDNRWLFGNLSDLPKDWIRYDEFFEFTFSLPPANSNSSTNETDGVQYTGRGKAIFFEKDGLVGWDVLIESELLSGLKSKTDVILFVGRDITDFEESKSLLIRAFVLSSFMTLVLAIVGSVLTSMVISRRLLKINQTCSLVMEGNLKHRMKTNGSQDGFDQLANNFNKMLSQIEVLMEEIGRVSDNIAHDLMTPLNRLRNRLEKLAMEIGGTSSIREQDREKVEAAIHDVDSMLSTFKALLRIARVESKSRVANFVRVSPRTLIDDAFDYYEPTAEEKDVQFERFVDSTGEEIYVDKDLVFQAIINLLDNAIKYTKPKGKVKIEGIYHHEGFEIIVSDNGPGIPTEFHEKVCRRSFRLDSSRSKPGNGLGLSLVNAVAKYHNIDLKFEDNQPGLKARLRYFPYVSKLQ